MSNSITNMLKQKFSLCPTYVAPSFDVGLKSNIINSNGRQAVGDGAFHYDAVPSVLAVCRLEGADPMYYYSSTFPGGPGVSF
jgi:hypothetical protein